MDSAMKDRLIEEAKQRSFQDILEKASQTEAVTLRDEVMKVGIVEAGTLRGLVDSIFERAVMEPATCTTLADFCQAMPVHFDPPAEVAPAAGKEKGAGSRSSSEKRIDFRLMVLKHCKEELEKGTAAVKAVKGWEAKESEGGKNSIKGDDKKQAEADRIARARMLVVIHFCGCLYNSGLLTEKIIHSCIDILLKDETDPKLEDMQCLCELLKSIGVKLDGPSRSSKEGKVVDKYFERMQKIKDHAVTKKIAGMVDDLMNLRIKNWTD